MEREKWMTYATLIGAQIQDMFQSESENYINPQELLEDENIKHFFHALATVVPNLLFNKLTGDEKDNLEFNHVANHLVFDFTNVKEG